MWMPGGVPMVSTPADRGWPMAVSDGASGAYFVWQEYGMIRAQRVTASGVVASGWNPAMGLLVCNEINYGGWMQSSPRAISDGQGGLFVLWCDQRNRPCQITCIGDPRQLFLQRLTPTGSIAPGWPVLGVDVGSALNWMGPTYFGLRDTWVSLSPVIAPDGAGGALIAWTEGMSPYRPSPLPGVHVQRVSGGGAKLWGDHGLVACAAPVGTPSFPSVAADGAGGAFVAWQDERDAVAGARIYLQHVSSSGQPLMEANGRKLDSASGAAERFPQIVSLTSGGLMVVRESGSSDVANSLVASPFADGPSGLSAKGPTATIETPITNTTLPDGQVFVIPASGGGAWVSWIDVRDPDHQAIYVQRLRDDGSVAANWPSAGFAICNGSVPGAKLPMLVEDGLNGAYVAWRDNDGTRVARVLAGKMARGWPAQGLAVVSNGYVRYGLHITGDGAHGALVVWDQWNPSAGLNELFAQRVAPLDVTPFVMTAPAPLAVPQGPPGGGTQFQAGDGAQLHAGGTSFDIRPNPTRGTIRIEMALARIEPAAIDVFDLVGRRVAHRDVAPGAQTLTIQEAESLTPGLYVVRLTQGDLRIVRRAIVSR
jgi:hypothetical protein